MDDGMVLAWAAAVGGGVLGLIGALVPGFPGSAVALLGLVAFAGITGFEVVPPPALMLAALIVGAATLAQLAAPLFASRAVGGTAGAATGAALGAAVGTMVPLPGAGWLAALVGALLLGTVASREGVVRMLKGAFGTAGGCVVAVGADLLGVFAVAAVLGLADFLTLLGA